MFLTGRSLRTLERFRHDFQKRILFSASYCTSRQQENNVIEEPEEELSDLPPIQVTEANQYELLSEAVTPLYKLPYKEQLQEKYTWTKEVIQEMVTKMKFHTKGKYGGKTIKRVFPRIENVRPSPVLEGYRNKDELNILAGVDGNPKTLGYFIGSPAKGNAVCVPGTHLLNMRSSHKALAQVFQEYVRNSELPAWRYFGPGGGNWRGLLLRSNDAGHMMAVAICNPQDLSLEQIKEEQDRLTDFFINGPGASVCPQSLYFQACRHTRCTHQQAPFELLLGEPYLLEEMHGFTFRVSPDSFFQVNTKAASVLYDTVLSLADIREVSTVLDLCCGTGIVSILAAGLARGCVGIDSVSDAIKDAKSNAKANNIFNAEFVTGLVENKLLSVIRDLEMSPDLVAVVNPGRTGLAPKAVRLLDECLQIRRVVYVSCKANHPNTRNNFIQLLTEGRFRLRRVVPVDLFPHTMHTELVLLFER